MLNRRLPSLTRRTGLVGGAASLTGTTSSISFSSVRFNSNNNSSKNEDADEIAREQRLREMFNNKGGSSNPTGGKASMWDQFKQIHAQAKQFAEQQTAAQMAARQQNQQQQGGNASNSTNATTSTNSSTTNVENLTSSGQQQQQQGTNNNTSSGGRPPVPSWFGPSQSFWTIMIYATALYSSFLVWQLSDEQSFVSLTQGVPHWANCGYDAAAYMLFRIIYSYRDQRRIQGEFEAMAPMAGSASFLDFLAQRYSMNLSGSTVSFQEVVALIAGAMRQDFPRYTTVIAQAANGARGEAREKIDAIANALRSQGVQPMYYNTNNTNNSNQQQQQQQRYPNQQQQFLGVPSHTYSPYSAPIPQQLQQQAQGMHPVSMTGYGNPQMMQQFQQRVYNPYYAQQQQQGQQQPNSTTGSAVADSSTTTSVTNNEQQQGGDSSSSAPATATDKQ